MDYTEIFCAVIALLGTLITAVIIPYIKSKTTKDEEALIKAISKTAVYAAQQLFSENEEKLKYAMEQIDTALKKKCIKLDSDTVRVQVEAVLKEIKVNALGGAW